MPTLQSIPVPGPTPDELLSVFRLRFGEPDVTGPLPRHWHRIGYFPPDVYYEAIVSRMVDENVNWLDVGCGRGIFPTNPELERVLANRCRTLVGVDPDPTIKENALLHESANCPIEEFSYDTPFDVVTLRMVAEHITQPEAAVSSLARLTRPGGMVVVFTVANWSPAALAARAVPHRLHHAFKRRLWNTEEKDTFPVAYRMNSRGRLRRLFTALGFREAYFTRLPDCCVFYRYRQLHNCELALWRLTSAINMAYPEACLLGIYERVGQPFDEMAIRT